MVCFDISNLGAEGAVAAVVASENGQARRGLYRRMRIRRPGPDDFAMIGEAVERYWLHVESGELPRPDLVVVDGGVGQLHAARAALDRAATRPVPLIGLAKREETVVRERGPSATSRRSPSLRALQRLRRGASLASYHRSSAGRRGLRASSTHRGVGPARGRPCQRCSVRLRRCAVGAEVGERARAARAARGRPSGRRRAEDGSAPSASSCRRATVARRGARDTPHGCVASNTLEPPRDRTGTATRRKLADSLRLPIEAFLDELRTGRRLSERTLDAYARDLADYSAFAADHSLAKWDEVTATFVDGYFASLHRRGLATATVARRRSALRGFHAHLARGHATDDDPVAQLVAPRRDRKLPHVLSIEDIERLLAQPEGQEPLALRDRACSKCTRAGCACRSWSDSNDGRFISAIAA